jgi:hypothetical protein
VLKLDLSLQGAEHTLRVFENRVPRGIYGPRSEEVARGWRKTHNELHSLSDIVRIIKVGRDRQGK